MNFPIPVNMTVDSGEAIQMTVQGDVTVSCVVDLRISPTVQETYDGPYSVTPSESVQTLETDEKLMADNVTVGAIPSDYVGSDVPRRTKNDINITKIVMPGGVQTPVAIAAKGYYQSTTVKDIPTGTATTPATSITANPTVSVDSNGLVTASVSASQSVTPTVNEGYVMSGTAGTVNAQGSSTLQISTQAAKTVTPTETEQTAVAAQKFTTGEVKVAAIPSDYIGSEVPQKSSSDLTVSGATVTAPAGYYAEDATKNVANGTIKSMLEVSAEPTVSVDSNGLVSAETVSNTFQYPIESDGYMRTFYSVPLKVSGSKTLQLPTQAAQTITPTTTNQTIASGTYLTGAQTIKGDANLLAENIKKDVTLFNVVGTYEGGFAEDTLVKALHNQVTSVEDDTLTSIRSYGLANMSALTSVSFPNLQTINTYAFYNDANLVMDGWIFPKAKTIANYAFRYCYGLTGDVVLPSTVTSIGQYSFASCKNITTFTATGSITTFGTYTFTGASADHKMTVREIHLPNLGTSIALNLNFGSATAANACQSLELVDIGKAKSIAANTFANCYALQTLIMRRTSVTTCANVSAFLNTPLRGRNSLTAKIYVPEALIDSYKAASVWTTINGYGYVEWLAIEGSPYEL